MVNGSKSDQNGIYNHLLLVFLTKSLREVHPFKKLFNGRISIYTLGWRTWGKIDSSLFSYVNVHTLVGQSFRHFLAYSSVALYRMNNFTESSNKMVLKQDK